MSGIGQPPFGVKPLDDQGFWTLPWVQYWEFINTINQKVDKLASGAFTAGHLIRAGSDGGIEDAGSEFAISNFSAYDAGGGTSAGIGTWTDMPFDTETHKDADFEHNERDDNEVEIKALFTGTAKITVYGTLYVSTHVNTTQVQVKIQVDSGEDYADVAALQAQLTFSSLDQHLNFSVAQAVSVQSGSLIKAVMSATSGGSTIETVAGATGIIIERKS